MAAFTSAGSGDWNASATWGNSGDPAVKGTDYPGNAGDTFTISSGHTVTYNVSESNQLGASTVNGILTFLKSTNTLLAFNHNDLTIGATGEVRQGYGTDVIDSTCTCIIEFATTSNNAKGVTITSGGKWIQRGSPSYYGSSFVTTLTSNWTSGQTFTVTGDYTTKWQANQYLVVPNNYYSDGGNANYVIVTIASMSLSGGNTQVTINETAPGVACYAGGYVCNLSRNVIVRKVSATLTRESRNTNMPRIYDTTPGGGIIDFMDSDIQGMIGPNRFGNASCKLENVVYRNAGSFLTSAPAAGWGEWSIKNCVCVAATAIFNTCTKTTNFFDGLYLYNPNSGFLASCTYISGKNVYLYWGSTVVSSSKNCEITNIYSTGVTNFNTDSWYCRFINGCIVGSYRMFYGGTYFGYHYFENIDFGYDKDGNSRTTTVWIDMNSYVFATCKNCKAVSSGIGSGSNQTGYLGRIVWDNANKVIASYKVVDNMGDVTKVTFDNSSSRPAQRTGGNTTGLEVVSYSNCASQMKFKIAEYNLSLPASSKTVKFYVQTDYVSLPATELYLVAFYNSNATTGETTAIQSTEAITTRSNSSDWSQYLSVAVNPSYNAPQFLNVRLELWMNGYESSKKVWIDPLVEIT